MKRCVKCSKIIASDAMYDEWNRPLCFHCWKLQDLKDERDSEDDPWTKEDEDV